jgi:hypothetical protein
MECERYFQGERAKNYYKIFAVNGKLFIFTSVLRWWRREGKFSFISYFFSGSGKDTPKIIMLFK